MRGIAVGLSLAVAGIAHADGGMWLDPGKGCGRAAAFAASGKVADLPGCSGKLPKNAPQIEVTLHDAKRALLDAEDSLERGKVEKLDRSLDEAGALIAHAQPMNPDLPDRWDQSQPLYERTIKSLRNRGRLLPRVEKLRASYQAAVDAARLVNADAKNGGPEPALRLARACLDHFAEIKAAGVDLAADVELQKGRLRPLEEARAECESIRKEAEPLVRAREKAAKARIAQWHRKLRGDRRRIFDAHPDAVPEVNGLPATPASAARASVWRYSTPAGIETFTFKRDRLVK